MLKALDIVPDDSLDLSLIIEAHMPGRYSLLDIHTLFFMIKLDLDENVKLKIEMNNIIPTYF